MQVNRIQLNQNYKPYNPNFRGLVLEKEAIRALNVLPRVYSDTLLLIGANLRGCKNYDMVVGEGLSIKLKPSPKNILGIVKESASYSGPFKSNLFDNKITISFSKLKDSFFTGELPECRKVYTFSYDSSEEAAKAFKRYKKIKPPAETPTLSSVNDLWMAYKVTKKLNADSIAESLMHRTEKESLLHTLYAKYGKQ